MLVFCLADNPRLAGLTWYIGTRWQSSSHRLQSRSWGFFVLDRCPTSCKVCNDCASDIITCTLRACVMASVFEQGVRAVTFHSGNAFTALLSSDNLHS